MCTQDHHHCPTMDLLVSALPALRSLSSLSINQSLWIFFTVYLFTKALLSIKAKGPLPPGPSHLHLLNVRKNINYRTIRPLGLLELCCKTILYYVLQRHSIKLFFSGAGAETVRIEGSSGVPRFDTFPDVDRRYLGRVYACYGLVPRCNAQSAT
jgi:hypothetical protein